MTQAPQSIPIEGQCDPRFERVRDTFLKNFAERNDVGASVAITLDGEYVVDLWGGHKDVDRTQLWREDTIVNVYSTTKTMAAMCLLMLADRGEIDLHARVAEYWPEFGCNGKEAVEVRHFLSHSAGLSGMDELIRDEELYDWQRVTAALARQTPWWEPGTKSGYHAVTQGSLLGEVVRRVTGRTLGTYFREEIAEPLSADFHIGTSASLSHRIGELIAPETGLGVGMRPDTIASRTFQSPSLHAGLSATSGWRETELPAINGHGNARSVARVQTVMANRGEAFGCSLLSDAGTQRIFEVQTSGKDLVLGIPIVFGMGYGINSAAFPMGPNDRIAYWGGWGGSTVVVDQDARLCVAYVMNRMEGNLLGDRRGFELLKAAYASL